MRIAIFSDIHGNCLALETVLADIKQTQTDSLICLGDAIQGGPQPRETVALLRDLACPIVMGNSDDWLITGKTIESLSSQHYEIRDWSLSKLSKDDCAFISQFPSTIEIELGKKKRLLCFHGSPKSYYNNILPTTSDAELQELLGDNQSFIYTGGHVHSQLLRRIGDTFYFRPGSVGSVYDRNRNTADFRFDPWAEYAVLNATDSQFSLEFRSIPLDIEKMKNIWLNSGQPGAEKKANLYYQE